ncbi:MAG: hypothetical protein ABFS12_10035, partial [Bacteroidota bacterium]
MKIAVFGQAYKTDSLNYIKDLLELLSAHEVHIVDDVYNQIKNDLNKSYTTYIDSQPLNLNFDYMISV